MLVYRMGWLWERWLCSERWNVGPYRGEGTCGRCGKGVGITGGRYTSDWDRGRDPRILQEHAQFGTAVLGVERPDCSAIATSSAQEGILASWGGGCDVGIDVWVFVPNIGGGCGTGWSP